MSRPRPRGCASDSGPEAERKRTRWAAPRDEGRGLAAMAAPTYHAQAGARSFVAVDPDALCLVHISTIEVDCSKDVELKPFKRVEQRFAHVSAHQDRRPELCVPRRVISDLPPIALCVATDHLVIVCTLSGVFMACGSPKRGELEPGHQRSASFGWSIIEPRLPAGIGLPRRLFASPSRLKPSMGIMAQYACGTERQITHLPTRRMCALSTRTLSVNRIAVRDMVQVTRAGDGSLVSCTNAALNRAIETGSSASSCKKIPVRRPDRPTVFHCKWHGALTQIHGSKQFHGVMPVDGDPRVSMYLDGSKRVMDGVMATTPLPVRSDQPIVSWMVLPGAIMARDAVGRVHLARYRAGSEYHKQTLIRAAHASVGTRWVGLDDTLLPLRRRQALTFAACIRRRPPAEHGLPSPMRVLIMMLIMLDALPRMRQWEEFIGRCCH